MGQAKEILTSYCHAGTAVLQTTPRLNRHAFEDLSLAALVYASRNQHLGPCNTQLARHALILGVYANDYYDLAELKTGKYVDRRRLLRQSGDPNCLPTYRRYFSSLRLLERHRPKPGHTDLCVRYRQDVNLVSLSLSAALAFGRPLDDFVVGQVGEGDLGLAPDSPPWFRSLFYTVMALQVIDDIVGAQGDYDHRRPSFYTAHGKPPGDPEVIKVLNQQCQQYLNEASRQDPAFSHPLVQVTRLLQSTYPKLCGYLVSPTIPQGISTAFVSPRDVNHR